MSQYARENPEAPSQHGAFFPLYFHTRTERDAIRGLDLLSKAMDSKNNTPVPSRAEAIESALRAIINGPVRISDKANNLLSEHDPKVIAARQALGAPVPTAVNAHESLVAALKRVVEWMDANGYDSQDQSFGARTALARAAESERAK